MKQFLKSKVAKTLVVAACVTAATQTTFAAESMSAAGKESLKIVPTLGYSYFNIQGSSTDFKSKGGNSLAVLAQLPMGDGLEVESGLEYLETGAKKSADLGFGLSFDTLTVTVKQLTIPLRAKYTFNPQSTGTRWYGKAGLAPTILISAKSDVPGGDSTDIKSDMNSIGLLSQAGFGADWEVAQAGRVSLDFTYSYGLTKVFKEDSGRAAGFQIAAGYAFSL